MMESENMGKNLNAAQPFAGATVLVVKQKTRIECRIPVLIFPHHGIQHRQ